MQTLSVYSGDLDGNRDAHGPEHLPRASEVRPIQVPEPVIRDVAVLLRPVRWRPQNMPRDGVCQDGNIGDDAPPGETLQMEPLLQGEDFHEGLLPVATGRPADRTRAHQSG